MRGLTPQQKGRRYERQKAKEIGGRTVPLSGAGCIKEDVESGYELYQTKFTTKASYSLKLAALKELELNATMRGLYPVFALSFNGEEYVIIRKQDYEPRRDTE